MELYWKDPLILSHLYKVQIQTAVVNFKIWQFPEHFLGSLFGHRAIFICRKLFVISYHIKYWICQTNKGISQKLRCDKSHFLCYITSLSMTHISSMYLWCILLIGMFLQTAYFCNFFAKVWAALNTITFSQNNIRFLYCSQMALHTNTFLTLIC